MTALGDITNGAPKGKKLEEVYQKKTQLEHILLRSDVYVGSMDRDTTKLWVMDKETKKMVFKNLSFVPGLYKIFDEILVNAADNKQRDSSMNLIQIDIDPESNVISVWNNGKGLPVEIHREHNMYVPDMVFGVLLTSSNYNDDDKKITGGRNGYGAKLTNIFSTEFTVETYDSNTGKYFKKTWYDNMSRSNAPQIQSKKGTDFTRVTFRPDLKKFGMSTLDSDIVELMEKRAWDLAGCTDSSVKVKLNGVTLPITDFKGYCELYPIGESLKSHLIERVNERWTVCVTASQYGFNQVSFVNSIWTYKGGKHVEYITSQLTEKIAEKLKRKKIEAKNAQIKNHLWVFINCLVENPSFDSQTKELLTTTKTKFGSTCQLSDKMLDALWKSDLFKYISETCNIKIEAQLAGVITGKKSSRLNIPKLCDANMAGTKESHKCTLVLTEGDSAKSLAISGFSIVGRDHWGVFPLRGKLLNVRDSSPHTIKNNVEVQNIMRILHLVPKTEYTSTKDLRYGQLMIMADQDHDGSHIKGLLINFIHYFWPSLLDSCPGFLVQFITPLIKATKDSIIRPFFSIPEFHSWCERTPNYNKYTIKYYKGLGTSTPAEAKQYFKELASHRIVFDSTTQPDRDAILLAFDKHKSDDRKQWLTTYSEGNYVDYGIKHLSIKDFVDKELILFSIADCERSIPSIMDGLKPSQRKILFCCFKRKSMTKKEIKVTQLAGYVGDHAAYHHGEASLWSTIINMAQDFVGSNNANILEPIGQFGTRLNGGKDASQARYLNTKLTPIARALFPEPDDELYEYKNEDGVSAEPYWYAPIIPMVLVNGAKGIGTGFSTSIPSYNPHDLVKCVRCMLDDEPIPDIRPWYRGFVGRIEPEPSGKSYKCLGVIKRVSRTVVNIVELPVEEWTESYTAFIANLSDNEIIYDHRDHSTDIGVDLEIQMDPILLDEWVSQGLEEKFKLKSQIPLTNMVCFDQHGKLCKYADIGSIMKEFYEVRLKFYRKRKDLLVEKIGRECKQLKNIVRFVLAVVNKELNILKRKKKDLLEELRKLGYDAFPPQPKKKLAKGANDYEEKEDQSEEEEDLSDPGVNDYNYLLGLKIWTLTYEKVESLQKQLRDKEGQLSVVLKTDPKDFWRRDLENFEKVYDTYEAKRKAAIDKYIAIAQSEKKANKGKTKSSRLEESTYVPKRVEKSESELANITKKRKIDKNDKKGGRSKAGTNTSEPKAKRQRTNKPKDDKEEKPAKVSKPRAPKAKPKASLFDNQDDEEDLIAPDSPKPKRAPAPPPKSTIKSFFKKKPATNEDWIVDDNEEEDEEDEDAESRSPVRKVNRSLRERKAVSYSLFDEEGSDNNNSPAKRPKNKKKVESDSEGTVEEEASDDSDFE